MKLNKTDREEFKTKMSLIYALVIALFALVVVIVSATIFFIADPDLSTLQSLQSTDQSNTQALVPADDLDKIENGIHVATGFIDAPGMMLTIQNCTNCHSSKLVIANRMNEERWIQTIRWMQKTQNLWNLGENEKIIVDYLVTNYPPKEVGRRANLSNIEWYELDE